MGLTIGTGGGKRHGAGGGSSAQLQDVKYGVISGQGNNLILPDPGFNGMRQVIVRPQLQSMTRTVSENGTIELTPSSTAAGISKATINVNVSPKLEAKTVGVEQNGTVLIQPSSGFDGLASVEVFAQFPPLVGDHNTGFISGDLNISSLITGGQYDIVFDNPLPGAPNFIYIYTTTFRDEYRRLVFAFCLNGIPSLTYSSVFSVKAMMCFYNTITQKPDIIWKQLNEQTFDNTPISNISASGFSINLTDRSTDYRMLGRYKYVAICL